MKCNCSVKMSSPHGDFHDEQEGNPRAGLVKAALAGKITNQEGARALRLTVRQFKRLKARFRRGGMRGLVHRRRGQPSPVNSTKTKNLNITNVSTSQSLVVSVPSPSPPFSLVSGGGTFTIGPCTIAPCPNHKVTFRFAPTSSGQAIQTLIISSTDPARPTKSIALDGTGTSK